MQCFPYFPCQGPQSIITAARTLTSEIHNSLSTQSFCSTRPNPGMSSSLSIPMFSSLYNTASYRDIPSRSAWRADRVPPARLASQRAQRGRRASCSEVLGAAQSCSGLLGAARSCSGLLGAARNCSGLLGAARSCSGLLGAARGCSGLIGAARRCSGLL